MNVHEGFGNGDLARWEDEGGLPLIEPLNAEVTDIRRGSPTDSVSRLGELVMGDEGPVA